MTEQEQERQRGGKNGSFHVNSCLRIEIVSVSERSVIHQKVRDSSGQ
jgi:hypothetical protein